MIKGMFTPYVEPNKPERIEPTVSDRIIPKPTIEREREIFREVAAHNNRNAQQRRSRKAFNPVVRNSRGEVRQSHTSYGHDDSGPLCNSPSPSPSPSSDSVCEGGE